MKIKIKTNKKDFLFVFIIIILVGIICFAEYGQASNIARITSFFKKEAEALKESLSEEIFNKEQIEDKLIEEIEKRKKLEEELISKKLSDKQLTEDKDGDGLTLKEEQFLGTSDLNKNSDNDLLDDNLDSSPAGGGRQISQYFEWSHNNNLYGWSVPIHSDWYDYYRDLPREDHGAKYVTYEDSYIKNIADKLIKKAKEESTCEFCYVISFIQGFSYVEDSVLEYDDYPKYPIETFVEGNGDCEDTSYLAASLLKATDRDVVLIRLFDHMAVGIWGSSDLDGTYYELDGKRYYYFETTKPGWSLGQIPDKYINSPAMLIEIPSGKTTEVNQSS